MNLVKDNSSDGLTVTWSIHNFSYYILGEFQNYLFTPTVAAEFLEGTIWYLTLYPKGDGASGFISLYLRHYTTVHYDFNLYYVFSIRVSNGKYKDFVTKSFYTHLNEAQGDKFFISAYELNKTDNYLDNDALTIRCRIWKNDISPSLSSKWYMHTKIKVDKIDCIWTRKEILDLKNDSLIEIKFNQTRHVKNSAAVSNFKIYLLLKGSFGEDTIHFSIEQPVRKDNLLLNCVIHLLDADGKVAHSVRDQYLFEKSTELQIWTFPFMSKHKLLSNKKLYLPSGSLTLRCQFSTSTGTANTEIERIENGMVDDFHLINSIQQNQASDVQDAWKENMQRCYQEGKYSDVTVQTPNRQFPVHKNIICAQSEVFSAMFERDMKENRTGVVEIQDLEDDAVSKMLTFLYTNVLEDLDFSMACKLYYAADRYRITALQRKCSNYLTDNLDSSNVCDVLELADTHLDQELKAIARAFIFAHDRKIINSEDWKKLMKANSRLASETMQLSICKKMKF